MGFPRGTDQEPIHCVLAEAGGLGRMLQKDLGRGMTAIHWVPGVTPRPSMGPRGRKISVRTEIWLCTGGRGYFEHHGEWGGG